MFYSIFCLENYLLPGVACREAFYYSIYKGKKQEALFRKREDDFALREENACARIVEAIHGIRAGQFPPVPEADTDVNQITVHTAARYEQWRIERKRPARCVVGDDEK